MEETKKQIEVTNDNEPIEYRKDFMKIKFELDDDLPLGKTFNIHDMIIVVASVLEKNSKHYPQIFDMNARMNYKNVKKKKKWCFRRN